MGSHQVNHVQNFMGRTLDLVLREFSNKFLDFEMNIPKPLTKIDPFHPPVLLSFETHIQSNVRDYIERTPKFKYADFVGLSNHLADTGFGELFLGKSLFEKINIFYDTQKSALDE